VGEADRTGPGGGGSTFAAVRLWVPGRTMASESWILGLVFVFPGLDANVRWKQC